MKKLIIILLVTFLSVGILSTIYAKDCPEVMEALERRDYKAVQKFLDDGCELSDSDIVIIDKIQIAKPPARIKPHVLFQHKKHQKVISCKDCHHTLQSEDETPRACRECHKKATDSFREDSETGPDPCLNKKCTKNIYHKKCRNCHKDSGRGPVKCKDCHRIWSDTEDLE